MTDNRAKDTAEGLHENAPLNELHVFDVSEREGITGDLNVVHADSKGAAKSMMSDTTLNSEFDNHAEEVEDGKYVSQSGEDLLELEMIAYLDPEAHYDGLDYLGTFEDAKEEMVSRLATGRCKSVLFMPPGTEKAIPLSDARDVLDARDEGRDIPNVEEVNS